MKILSIYMDGNAWCCAEGSYPECTNPHEHIQGFGETESGAIHDYLKNAGLDF